MTNRPAEQPPAPAWEAIARALFKNTVLDKRAARLFHAAAFDKQKSDGHGAHPWEG